MKPATNRNNWQRVISRLLNLVIVLVAFLECPDVQAQDNLPESKSVNEKQKELIWHSDGLPRSAVLRYGSTDRNPTAIGIYGLRFSADGSLLAARDRRQNIRVLDLKNQKVMAILPTQAVLDFLISPDNKSVITGDRRNIQVWNIAEGEIEREFKCEGYRLAISSDPDELVVAGKGTVSRFRLPFPSKPTVIRSKLPGSRILSAGVSNDGKFAIFHNGGKSEVLDTINGRPIATPLAIVPNKAAIFSPNSHLLADVNYGDSKLRIFDLRNSQKYNYLLQDKRRVVTATFSNDSRFLYTSNYDNSIVIWDLVTMQAIDRVEGHGARIYTLAANPNQLLSLASGASGSADRSLLYWDFRDRLFPKFEEQAGDIAFDQIWKDLGSDDAAISLTAVNQLYRAIAKDSSIATQLVERMGIDRSTDNSQATKLIADLDAPKYEVRAKATVALRTMVDRIRPMLERQLEKSSQEAKWRIMQILSVDRLRPEIMTAAGRRKHRIVLALELCGNDTAKDTLETIARNSSNATMVELAKAAIIRLSS